MAQQSQRVSLTFSSTSNNVVLTVPDGYQLIALLVPSGTTGLGDTFRFDLDGDSTGSYPGTLYDAGTLYTLGFAAGRYCPVKRDLFLGVRYVKISNYVSTTLTSVTGTPTIYAICAAE